ncbi:MAG: hypothetical protein U5K30_08620 [Acidimicrobiales bacterium]|nr:hypothetical protein [Acidimicrobiales bacterium]
MAVTTGPTPRAVLIFFGLRLGQVMSNLDGTIVATARPSIVDDVGGLSRATWVIIADIVPAVPEPAPSPPRAGARTGSGKD